ncbi:MAG: hypothetical protein WCQ99_00860 [Pseudomonadota bacterium]
MQTIYFDTNIYDHIYKNDGITLSDYTYLNLKIKNNNISILPSILNIEEIYSALKYNHVLVVEELKLIKNLAICQKIIKAPLTLLQDDIQCFAEGIPLFPPFISDSLLIKDINDFLDWPMGKRDFEKVIIETLEQKKSFQSYLLKAKKDSPAKIKNNANHLTFKEFLNRYQLLFSEALAEKTGLLAKCQSRDIGKLLNIKSIYLYTGVGLSLVYAVEFENRSPKSGDSRDLLHALCACAADIFVTNDSQFLRLIKRLPVENYTIMNINEFLEYLHSI